MKYGIAFIEFSSITPERIIGWKQKNGRDETWNNYGDALEANDLGGWTGYVRRYPSGEKESNKT